MFPRLWLPWIFLQKNYQHGALLRRIVDRIRNSLELRVMVQTAVDEIAASMQVDRCIFFWYFHDTNRVQMICESRWPVGSVPGKDSASAMAFYPAGYVPMETFGPLASAIARGQLVVQHHPRWWWHKGKGGTATFSGSPILGERANLMVPLNTQDGAIGFIGCLSDRPRCWSATELDLLQAIAQQLTIAIGQAQLYEQTQKQAQRERLVNQITAQTRQSFELADILQGAIARLLDALQVDRCLVHLVDEGSEATTPEHATASKRLTSHYAVSPEKHLYEVCREPFEVSTNEFDLNGPITQWVITNRRRVVISDVTMDERIGPNNVEYQRAEIKSSLVVPVQTKEALYAILYLNQCSQIRYWSKNDQKLAQAVADQLAISIQQARLYAQTQEQAIASADQAQHLAETLRELQLTQAQLIQSEKMSSLGRVVAGIAHEINNPVNFIYGNLPYIETYVHDLVTLLKIYQAHTYPPPTAAQALMDQIELDFVLMDLPRILKSMHGGAERIREVVASLRNFARLDEAQYKRVDLHEGIESTLLILQSYLADDVQIIRRYAELPTVECYPRQLNQAILNIVLNAIDALNSYAKPHKQIEIRTEIIPQTDLERSLVRIVIADNGPGIDHTIQAKIFDPFFTTKPVGQGAGLGLTVSYQIVVNQHHGQLKCVSEPGFGTEFTLELPIYQPLPSSTLPSQTLPSQTLTSQTLPHADARPDTKLSNGSHPIEAELAQGVVMRGQSRDSS